MPMKQPSRVSRQNAAACRHVLAVLRREKPHATGRVFTALHRAEGMFAVASGAVRSKYRRKTASRKSAPRKKSDPVT